MSASQQVQLKNGQAQALNITGVVASGSYVESNDCISAGATSGSLPAGGSCTINVSFTPTAIGTLAGTLTIDDDGPGSPQTVQLSGKGSSLIPGGFVGTSAMNSKRSFFTATLLPSGQVLMVGGLGPGGAVTSAELYDPQTRRFGLTGTLPKGSFGAATLLMNGKVLLVSGKGFASAIYDPQTQNFSGTGFLPGDRFDGYTATLLNNGKVLVAGGFGQNVQTGLPMAYSSAVLYDPNTGHFTQAGSMTVARWDHTATLLNDGRVLIAGGSCYPNTGCNADVTAEIYDPAIGFFQFAGFMSTSRDQSHTATLLNNGKVLIAGGFSVSGFQPPSAELFDPLTGSFTVTGEMVGNSTILHTATPLTNGLVLIAGGDNTSRAQLYDPGTGIFTLTGSMAIGRSAHTATRLSSGQVLIAGGEAQNDFTTALASAEIYTPRSGSIVSLSTAILSFGSQAVGSASTPQIVTLKNTGKAVLTISGIAASGDFKQGNNCNSTVAIGGTCTISVSFKPTATGTRLGLVTITDNAPDSPQTISLEGYGTGAIGSVAPNPLVFSLPQLIGTASASKLIALSNQGNSQMTVNSVAVAGDFAIASNFCTNGVQPGTHCNVGVTFTPKNSGIRNGTLTFVSNAANSPEVVKLTGTGTQVKLSATSIVFTSQPVNTSSTAKTVTVTNVGSGALSFIGISISGANAGDFSETNTCGTNIAGGASCKISVIFKPSATGLRVAVVSINDDGGASPQKINLTGTGT